MLLVSSFRHFPRITIAEINESEFTDLEEGATGGVPLSRIDPEAQAGSLTWIVDVPAGEFMLIVSLLGKETDLLKSCFYRFECHTRGQSSSLSLLLLPPLPSDGTL